MPIQRHLDINLHSKGLCKLITDLQENIFDQADEAQALHVPEGFKAVSGAKRELPGTSRGIALPRYVTRRVILTTRQNRVVQTADITEYDLIDFNFSLQATLSVKASGLPPGIEDKIKSAFMQTILAVKDIDIAEQDLIKSGVSISDYIVDIGVRFEKIQNQPLPNARYNEYLRVMESQVDANKQPIYTVTPVEDYLKISCEGEGARFPDESIVITDPDHPEDAIKRRVKQKDKNCTEITVIKHKIGTAFKIPEVKTEWRTETVFGCFKTDIPVFFTRETSYILMVSTSCPDSVFDALKTDIYNCIADTALEALLLSMVVGFEEVAAAKDLFIASALSCIEKHVTEKTHCLIPDLFLVAEQSNWQQR